MINPLLIVLFIPLIWGYIVVAIGVIERLRAGGRIAVDTSSTPDFLVRFALWMPITLLPAPLLNLDMPYAAFVPFLAAFGLALWRVK